MPEVKLVPLEQIEYDLALQSRESMSLEHIQQLRELIQESDEERQQTGAPLRVDLFPPLTVFTRGGLTDLFHLSDGFHRYESLEQAGRDAWPCEIHISDDPRSAAEDHSFIANTTHGLRRDAATCQRIFRKIRKKYPNLQMYGKDGIEGKTGLSRGFIYIQLKRLKEAGTPDAHTVAREKENPNKPAPKENGLRAERHDQKTNPNHEPLQDLGDEPETENIVAALAASKKSKEEMIDELGREVPPGLREKFNRSAVMSWVHRLGVLKGEVDKLYKAPGWEYLDAAGVGRFFASAQAAFNVAAYHTDCPKCDVGKTCTLCRGAGYITETQYGKLSDKDKAALKD